jgi:hypothetical protein
VAVTTSFTCLLAGALAVAGALDSTFSLEKGTAADGARMLAQATKDGLPAGAITIRSGYRPGPAKHPLAGAVVRTFGADELARWIAGRSEHLTGKSVDLQIGGQPAHQWLRQHAREFGFNQAFPGEPWHFTHNLPAGATEGPVPGTVAPGYLGTVVRHSPDRRADAADRVITGDAVAWLADASAIVYTQCWREEGGGDGCVVKWQGRRDRKVTRTLPVFLPGEADTEADRRARILAAKATLGPALAGATLLESSYPWVKGMQSVPVGPRQQISWDGERSALDVSGGPLVEVARLHPWVASPIHTYADRERDFAVVEMLYDPGSAFLDGANVISRFEIVEGVELGLSRSWRKGTPADVVHLVERYGGCNHWGGEEGYDAERRQEIEAGMEALGCDRIEDDQHKLQKKYRGKPAILRTIDLASSYEDDD